MILTHVKKHIAAAGLASVVLAGAVAGATPAQARPLLSAQSHTETTHYSDRDVVELFAFGSGPLAERHPEAVEALFGQAPRTSPTDEAVDAFTAQLKALDPVFETRVLPGLTSRDPMRTQSALVHFASDAKQVAQVAPSGTTQSARPNDVFYVQNNVAVVNEVAQSLSVVTSYVAAAEFIGTVVLAYRYTDGVSDLEQTQAVSAVANAFA